MTSKVQNQIIISDEVQFTPFSIVPLSFSPDLKSIPIYYSDEASVKTDMFLRSPFPSISLQRESSLELLQNNVFRESSPFGSTELFVSIFWLCSIYFDALPFYDPVRILNVTVTPSLIPLCSQCSFNRHILLFSDIESTHDLGVLLNFLSSQLPSCYQFHW